MSHTEKQNVTYYSGHVIEVNGKRYVKERTCRNVSTVKCKFTCSACHQSWRHADKANGRIAYCPSCGARVIEGER